MQSLERVLIALGAMAAFALVLLTLALVMAYIEWRGDK